MVWVKKIGIFTQPFAKVRSGKRGCGLFCAGIWLCCWKKNEAKAGSSVKLKNWLIFVCTQTAGVVAMHLGHDWSLILGVLLLVPGIPALYLFSGIHRLIMIGDFRLAVAGILINAGVWCGSASILRWLKKKT
jgi:hypothetical protein